MAGGSYQDDTSRFIVGYGVFANATSENAVKVLKEAIKDHGRAASVLTDHDSQFYANESEYKTRGATEFEKTLVQLGIKHILARVNHPQTNGKLERFHGEIQRKQKWFDGIDELIHWYNYKRPHMSLNLKKIETPYEAYNTRMPEPGTTVIDEESGEVYDVRKE